MSVLRLQIIIPFLNLSFPTQENVYDIYAEVAFFMSWINETILSMGGMQGCGLTLEKTPTAGTFTANM